MRCRQIQASSLAALLRLPDSLKLASFRGRRIRSSTTVLVVLPTLRLLALFLAISLALVRQLLFPGIEHLPRVLVASHLLLCVVESRRRRPLERNVGIVIHLALLPRRDLDVDTSSLQLSPLLQLRHPLALLQLPLASLSLRLFTLSVRQPSSSLRQHLLLIFIHINRIRPRRSRFWLRIHLSRPQLPHIVRTGSSSLAALRPTKTQLSTLPGLSLVQQFLIALQTLRRGAADDGRDGAPLRRHQLGQVQQLLVFLAAPFDFPDAWVQPFGPARFALLGSFAREQ